MPDSDSRSVYLAAVSSTLEEQARRIRLDLKHRGILVRSGGSTGSAESEASIKRALAQSLLSVHLLGNTALSSEDVRAADILGGLEAAFDYSSEHPEFPIFVWCGSDDARRGVGSSADFLQSQLLTHRNREVGPNTEIVQSSLEDFKSLVYDHLGSAIVRRPTDHRTAAAGSQLPAGQSTGPELYVIFDQQDRDTAKPITEFIQGAGVTVLEPVFEGEQSTLRSIHNDYLRRCDAALIIYGKVREPWVRMKQQDLLRAPALGRRKSLAAKGVMLCSLMTDVKMRFTAPDMMVLKESADAGAQFALSSLLPFLKKLSAA